MKYTRSGNQERDTTFSFGSFLKIYLFFFLLFGFIIINYLRFGISLNYFVRLLFYHLMIYDKINSLPVRVPESVCLFNVLQVDLVVIKAAPIEEGTAKSALNTNLLFS